MRYLNIITSFIFIVVLTLSCTPCDKYECATDTLSAFRIKSTDGKDLLFGQNKRYDKSLIRFYSFKMKDTTYFQARPEYLPAGVTWDSVLIVSLSPFPDTVYMRLSDGDIDTLALTSVKREGGRCCRGTTEIKNYRLNDKVDFPPDISLLIVK